MHTGARTAALVDEVAGPGWTPQTPLVHIGLDSLQILSLAAEVSDSDGIEIDVNGLAEVSTVGDLAMWLTRLEESAPASGATA